MNKIKSLIMLLIISVFPVFSSVVTVDITSSNEALLYKTRQSVFLKIGLTGSEILEKTERPPVNVALVLDRSGSMSGDKMTRAKEAARMAVDLLDERDIVSIITYSDSATVLVPATKLTDRDYIKGMISEIHADGSTALFAGVSKGAGEVKKFKSRETVDRVILISDGLANVGPESPRALGKLGKSLKKQGISVTTIGLGTGYNEDLMVQLASKSDGNHAFVENSRDLARVFQYEFSDLLSVVARDVTVEIICSEGVFPKRTLGREADIIGHKVITTLNQLYSQQEKYIMIELDVDPQTDSGLELAKVKVDFTDLINNRNDRISGTSYVSISESHEIVKQGVNKNTMVEAVKQIAVEAKEKAIELRDDGMMEEAQAVLDDNVQYILEEAKDLAAPELDMFGASASKEAELFADEDEWNTNRKRMKASSYEVQNQQSFGE